MCLCCCCSVTKLYPTLQTHGLQHTRLPYPSLSPRVCSNSYLLSQWSYLTISPSAALFSFCFQSSPASGSFPVSRLYVYIFQSLSCVQLFATTWTARLPCPLSTPGACSNSCPLSRWCHPTNSSSVIPFSSCLQYFSASGSFPISWLFASCGQIIGTSASASVLPMNIQGWFPFGLTGLIKTIYMSIIMCAQSCLTLCDPMDWDHQALISMGFSQQEYWNGLPFTPAQNCPNTGIKLTSTCVSCIEGRFFTTEPLGNPYICRYIFFLSLVKRFNWSFRKLRAVIDAEDCNLEVRKRE